MDPTLDQLTQRLFCGRLPLPDLVTAGQPRPDDLAAAAAAGVRVVVDLRRPDEARGFEEAEVCAAHGLAYVSLPTEYSGVPDAHFDTLRELLRDPQRRPALVHCASANRVGGMLIPYFVVEERLTPDDAIELASEIGLRSPALAEAAFSYLERQGIEPTDIRR